MRESNALGNTYGVTYDFVQIEIAEDDSFTRLLKRQIVTWQQGTLPLIDHDGHYFWRVASIDASGLRGPYSAAFTLAQDYYLRRSRAALEQGDLKSVRENLALADQALDDDIDRLLERALGAISQQHYAEATVDLETVLALRATDAAARNALARLEPAAPHELERLREAGGESEYDDRRAS